MQKEKPPRVPDNFGFANASPPALLSHTQSIDHKISKDKIVLKREIKKKDILKMNEKQVNDNIKKHQEGRIFDQ